MRIALRIAYDGTNYCGYQSQVNGVTVQDTLEAALSALFGTKIRTLGASRTDTGVHARCNVGVFDVDTRILPGKIAYALNARLPEDIRILESREVPADFHPRYTDSKKTYIYRIYNERMQDPLTRLYTFHYYYPLDIGKMAESAAMILGEHDFRGFCSAGYSGVSTVRTIYRSEISKEGSIISYTVTGNGFLYNMVRILAGTLIAVGSGRMEMSVIPEIFASKDRSLAADTAPAKGLTLERIEYADLPDW